MNALTPHPLFLDEPTRSGLWRRLAEIAEAYVRDVSDLPVEQLPSQDLVRSMLERFDFIKGLTPVEAIEEVAEAMRRMQTHTAHPRYFGLFNPAPTSIGVIGDALAAVFNSQLAAWSHSPFAVEAERYLIRSIGSRFDPSFQYGCFTSGGAEANLTAMVSALVQVFPSFATGGVRSLAGAPIAYVSAAAHHSFVKAARVVGLGTSALRVVPCDDSLRMDVDALLVMIREDRAEGNVPFFVVATAGATSTGIVEPIDAIADIALAEHLWLHVDAAWGGFAAFVPELKADLHGVNRADSLTFDPHKMLSVPMGAGLYLTRHRHSLGRSFSVVTDYMPAQDSRDDREDPFTHSIQWSRRFIGLKVLLSLAVAGWDGYADALRRQVHLGNVLRRELEAAEWPAINKTPFPVVCSVPSDPRIDVGRVVSDVQRRGNAWISLATLPNGRDVLRACVTNYRTNESDICALVEEIVNVAAMNAPHQDDARRRPH